MAGSLCRDLGTLARVARVARVVRVARVARVARVERVARVARVANKFILLLLLLLLLLERLIVGTYHVRSCLSNNNNHRKEHAMYVPRFPRQMLLATF